VDGAPEVKIHAATGTTRARIVRIDSMSAHADRGEILQWLGTLPSSPGTLCLVHGEPGPMNVLKQSIEQRLGRNPRTPAHHERMEV
jgi:metallo-beta-lactamase family protein